MRRLRDCKQGHLLNKRLGYICEAVGGLLLLELPWCFLLGPGLHVIIFRFEAYGTGLLWPERLLHMSQLIVFLRHGPVLQPYPSQIGSV